MTVYGVAGQALACDRPIPSLAALRSERTSDLTVRFGPVALPPRAATVFDGSARVGTRECKVRCLSAGGRDLLQISGAGAFSISREPGSIEVDPEPGAGGPAVEEALLGPALVLALARRGIFVLHASAVLLQGEAIGFLGDSGAGKSTLARLLAEEGAALAADDLLAIAEGPAALPHFPQLKLEPAAMTAIAGLSPRYPLRRLYALAPAPPEAEVASADLHPVGAASLLLRHTVAGRLFAADLLSAHFDFAVGIAGSLPLRRLTVPRRLDVGAEVLRHLAPG